MRALRLLCACHVTKQSTLIKQPDSRLKRFKIWSRRFSNQTCVSQVRHEYVAMLRLAESVVSDDCAGERMSIQPRSLTLFLTISRLNLTVRKSYGINKSKSINMNIIPNIFIINQILIILGSSSRYLGKSIANIVKYRSTFAFTLVSLKRLVRFF